MSHSGSTGRRSGPVAVVVLAAGLSSRMGRTKQLILFKGKPLLRHVVDAAASSVADEIVIVLGHRADDVRDAIAPLPARARVVVHEDYGQGQASSLLAGLRASSDTARAAVVVLGDQPQLDPSIVNAAIGHWRNLQPPVVRTLYRRTPGHPVVLDREIWPLIANEGDEGARRLMAERPDLVTDLEVNEPPPIDVDTPDEVATLDRAELLAATDEPLGPEFDNT